MKIGVFSLIPWSFLDQRPQVFAKQLASWGHQVTYFGTFTFESQSPKISDHPWDRYLERSWNKVKINENLETIHPLLFPAHKWFSPILKKNEELMVSIKEKLIASALDLAIVVDPLWGRVMKELNIPFIYDHVDDTHHMEHVITDFFYEEALFCEKNSLKNIYIQPGVASRNCGMFVPNGITFNDLFYRPETRKDYDAVCLSCIADWFDMDSVLNSKKKILLIGPMIGAVKDQFLEYKYAGGTNIDWVPELPRSLASLWLNRSTVGIIPFKENHGVVDYVMPLKIVEYYYMGLSAVSYVNKGVEDLFGDHVHFYSPSGWLGAPSLDDAIDKAKSDSRVEQRRNLSKGFSWEEVMNPLKEFISLYENTGGEV